MRKPGQSRSLFPTLLHTDNTRREAAQPPPAAPQTAPSPVSTAPERAELPRTLWLALQCTELPLLACGGARISDQPVAIIVDEKGALSVCASNDCAVAQGVTVGVPLTAAYALVPDLITRERDEKKEQRVLERLAAWSMQFTSTVNVLAPNTLLLEVQGSLKLFGGLPTLVQQLHEQLRDRHVRHRLAVAPTARAALWSARSPTPVVLDDATRLPDLISRLPLSVTRWPLRTLQRLDGMGLRQIGDVLRLPRDGFARRFGRERRLELDQALGIAPDPRTPFVMAPEFEAHLDLLCETERITHIEHALGELIDELEGVLRAHQRGVAALRITLAHLDIDATCVQVGLAAPTRDAVRLKRVVHERLDALTLRAPVVDVALRAAALVPLDGRDGDLFSRSVNGYDWPQLVETLRARLGVSAVHGVCLVPEHRPEAAWRYVEPGTTSPAFAAATRPLWMLSEPVRLPVREGWPQWDGALRILRGPERIETGWWDGRDVARDYYVAVNPHTLHLWIYRRRRAPRDWYLHGVFA